MYQPTPQQFEVLYDSLVRVKIIRDRIGILVGLQDYEDDSLCMTLLCNVFGIEICQETNLYMVNQCKSKFRARSRIGTTVVVDACVLEDHQVLFLSVRNAAPCKVLKELN